MLARADRKPSPQEMRQQSSIGNRAEAQRGHSSTGRGYPYSPPFSGGGSLLPGETATNRAEGMAAASDREFYSSSHMRSGSFRTYRTSPAAICAPKQSAPVSCARTPVSCKAFRFWMFLVLDQKPLHPQPDRHGVN